MRKLKIQIVALTIALLGLMVRGSEVLAQNQVKVVKIDSTENPQVVMVDKSAWNNWAKKHNVVL